MALSDITLNDGQGTPASHVFTYVGTVNNRVLRADLSAPAEEPLNLAIAHSEKVQGGIKVRSHLLRFDFTILDADGVTPYAANIRVMADVPVKALSDGLADDMAAFVRNYLSSATTRLWLKGSVG